MRNYYYIYKFNTDYNVAVSKSCTNILPTTFKIKYNKK